MSATADDVGIPMAQNDANTQDAQEEHPPPAKPPSLSKQQWAPHGITYALLVVVIAGSFANLSKKGSTGVYGGVYVGGNESGGAPSFRAPPIRDPFPWRPAPTNPPPDPAVYGQWEIITPTAGGAARGSSLGIMGVHSVLLPSGKVLISSGSSWRNRANDTEVYPDVPNPRPGNGVFHRDRDPFRTELLEDYYGIVNNVGVWDPATNHFARVPHPVPVPDPHWPDHFVPSDQFCSGQLQLRDGNPIFIGGTQYYDPYRTGTNTSYIFDWRKELTIDWSKFDWTKAPAPNGPYDPWVFSGLMARGRWYPSPVPLLDGRFAIFSGFVGFRDGPGANLSGSEGAYQFEINTYVDFFDPDAFSPSDPQAAWRSIDISQHPNSPFATPLPQANWTAAATDCGESEQSKEECQAYRYDAFKLYPRAFLLSDGRIFFTRDGDYNSLRTPKAEYMRNTNFTYLMTIGGTRSTPTVSFELGPELPYELTSSGTAVRDPNDHHRILITGGFPNYGGTVGPGILDVTDPLAEDPKLGDQYLGSAANARLAIYTPPTASGQKKKSPPQKRRSRREGEGKQEPINGHWNVTEDFLYQGLTMHYMIVLPTKQMFVAGGGRYDFGDPVRDPILLTPIHDLKGRFTGNYSRKLMSPHQEGRLYHSIALLLADGRVVTMGGNSNRASVDDQVAIGDPKGARGGEGQVPYNPARVDRTIYGGGIEGNIMKRGHKQVPAETWVGEVYSPPYLFIDGNRRAVVVSLEWVPPSLSPATGYTPSSIIGGKTYYLLHSNYQYKMVLEDLPRGCRANEGALVLLKLGSSTHGWDCGQAVHDIPISGGSTPSTKVLTFVAPDAVAFRIVPAFYHLFYLDCHGKPAVALPTRYDDDAKHV